MFIYRRLEMLSAAQQKKRKSFYASRFSDAWLSHQVDKRSALWCISAYDEKLKGLSERGFKDPYKMIASSPAILGLSFDNIDEKLRKAKRLKANVDDFIAYTIVFIGMSAKHYIPILRKCRKDEVSPSPKSVFKIYKAKSFVV
jgi:hypothetical protein